jgi:asparagine synthase (glutamine-hydrolysing)
MVKTDIAPLANSLEVRCPFLDHEFIEFAATIPSRLKRDLTGGKIILKRAVKDLLPNEILIKPKTGFGLSIAKWFRSDLASMLKETLLDETSERRGLFEQHLLQKMVNEHIGGRRD